MPESALELFRTACGLYAPLALECHDPTGSPGGYTPYHFECPFLLVGRDRQSDLILEGPQVSRRHAFIQIIRGRPFCIDLESRTKLRWERETEPRARGWLDPCRSVKVGPYEIRWVPDGRAEDDLGVLPD